MKLINLIKKRIETDGKYCGKYCSFKIYTECVLFGLTTGYDWKKEKAKRLLKCLKEFPEKPKN